MKKWIWILGFAAVLLFARVEPAGAELRELEPVELVFVVKDENGVRIETDTGAQGSADSLQAAVEDLHKTAPATVFLDTAQYLVITETAREYLPQLYKLLRPACYVCVGEDGLDLEEAAKYLQVHPPRVKLLQWAAGEEDLPKLSLQEGRGQLESGIDQS